MQDITRVRDNQFETANNDSFIRPRLNSLLTQIIKKPLVIVCASMGCGKTQAVYDFSRDCGMPVAWVQLSESDNIVYHFWENFIRAIAQTDSQLTEECRELGFPGSEDKLIRYFKIRSRIADGKKYMLVFDDFHYLKNEAVLSFLERTINNIQVNRSIVLISREFPQINISSMMVRDSVTYINEEELNFTKAELFHYLHLQGLDAETNSLDKIYKDTNGWAFIINFVVRMLKKTPGYAGYVQGAIKKDIFQLIESENWATISGQLKRLFLKLSLTDHRSAGLVELLCGSDVKLISELNRQNAFVRFDTHIDYYYIHHLFIEFLYTKRDYLTNDETKDTYKTIADWCMDSDFIVDALLNYEKSGDYESVVSILFASPTRFLMENVRDILEIFNRIDDSIFDSVELSAAVHIQLVMNTGDLHKTVELMHYYEAKYLGMPEDSGFRNRMLGCIYYQWAVFRLMLCTVDDCYDFDDYYAKACAYLKDNPIKYGGSWYQHPPGMWTCLVGSSRAGAPQEFLEALTRASQYSEMFAPGLGAGVDDLCHGELLFYQGHISQSEPYFSNALKKAREHGQFEIIWRVLFYSMRIAMYQGEYSTIELALKDMEELLENNENPSRYIIHDIILGWYYYNLTSPDQIPYWLKDNIVYLIFYSNSMENYGNLIKAKYCYLVKNYSTLLDYFEKTKRRDTILYEKVELLALEACVYYQMKDKETAFSVLNKAYEMASPNNIVMPFIELGKDMRLLITAAAGDAGCKIPQAWFKNIKLKVSAYYKNQAQVSYKYKQANEFSSSISLSPRETEILKNLCDGLSRSEIAAELSLSINTVKVHINSIYEKLNAHSRADIYRIAIEQNLL